MPNSGTDNVTNMAIQTMHCCRMELDEMSPLEDVEIGGGERAQFSLGRHYLNLEIAPVVLRMVLIAIGSWQLVF